MLEINISNLIITQIDIKKAGKTKCFTRFLAQMMRFAPLAARPGEQWVSTVRFA